MRLYTIDTELFKLDGGAMFGVVPKSMWNKVNPADENNMCTWAMRLLLIEDGRRLILIDTGIGNKQDAKFFSYYYLNNENTLDKSLAQKGFHKDDITDVILTHLHFDHCGGAIMREGDKLIPAFKNATFWSNQDHWQWAIAPNAREKASFLKENILPMQESEQLKFIEVKEGIEFNENISIRFVNGHTMAMMLPQIKYGNKTLVYVADLFPGHFHIPLPWVMAYDMFPLTTLEEKDSFLKEALKNDYVLYFEHDPEVECCTVKQTERGIRMDKTFRLSEL